MAELIYDAGGRLLFTKEMKRDFVLLAPQMLPIHFELIHPCGWRGYRVEMLKTNHRGIVDEGLKYVRQRHLLSRPAGNRPAAGRFKKRQV